MSDIILLIGIGVFIIGGFLFLVAEFRTSVLWGLGCLLIAPVTFLYLFIHWSDAKKPFGIQLIGFAIVVTAAYMQGLIRL